MPAPGDDPVATAEPEEAPTPTPAAAGQAPPTPSPAPRPAPAASQSTSRAPSGTGDDSLDLGATVLPVLLRTYGPRLAAVLGLVALLAVVRRVLR